MTNRTKVSELPEFDGEEFLNSEEEIAAYLTTVLEENDPALLVAAIQDIAHARAMIEMKETSGSARYSD